MAVETIKVLFSTFQKFVSEEVKRVQNLLQNLLEHFNGF